MSEPTGSACQSDEQDGHCLRAARKGNKNSGDSSRLPNDYGRRAKQKENVTRESKDLTTVFTFASHGNLLTGSRAGSRIIAG